MGAGPAGRGVAVGGVRGREGGGLGGGGGGGPALGEVGVRGGEQRVGQVGGAGALTDRPGRAEEDARVGARLGAGPALGGARRQVLADQAVHVQLGVGGVHEVVPDGWRGPEQPRLLRGQRLAAREDVRLPVGQDRGRVQAARVVVRRERHHVQIRVVGVDHLIAVRQRLLGAVPAVVPALDDDVAVVPRGRAGLAGDAAPHGGLLAEGADVGGHGVDVRLVLGGGAVVLVGAHVEGRPAEPRGELGEDGLHERRRVQVGQVQLVGLAPFWPIDGLKAVNARAWAGASNSRTG